MEGLIKEKVINELRELLNEAIKKSGFNEDETKELVDNFLIEVPVEACHGDFATNVAMTGAKVLKKAPHLVAEQILKYISLEGSSFERVEFAKPGFINFFLKNSWFEDVLKLVIKKGDNFGKINLGKGKKVLLEFVSANPTGPMHIGNARGGAIGDCLAELFYWAGFDVKREFYLNDAGNQIEKFKRSLSLRYMQLFVDDKNFQMPEDSYQGDDIIELAKQFADLNGDKYINCSQEEREEALVKFALPLNVAALKSDLEAYRIIYDKWFCESELYKEDRVNEVVDKLKQKGYTYEKDGAIWFAFTKCGGSKDEVLVRDNGIATYFAADIAYHYNKFFYRKFDLAIDVWGADHHGHVARLKGALKVLGVDEKALEIVLMQLVRLVRDGQAVRLSKRSGKAITLSSLLEEVSVDAARFFFNLREANSHFDFDLDLAVSQSNNNPVYYVQYAYARICQLLDKEGLNGDLAEGSLDYEFSELERSLIKEIAELESEIKNSVLSLNSSIIAKYAIDLANKFHRFYAKFRVLGEEESKQKARSLICLAVKVVLKNIFYIMKIEAKTKL